MHAEYIEEYFGLLYSRTHTNIYNTMAQVSFSSHMSSGSGDYSTALSNSFLSIDKDLQEGEDSYPCAVYN